MAHETAITEQDIARARQARRWDLTFPEPIEALFEHEIESRRARIMRKVMPRTIVIYNLFLVGDYFLVPDVFGLAVIVHLTIVTPWMIAATVLIGRTEVAALRHYLVASIPISMVAGIIVVFSASRAPYAEHYQYFVIMALIYANATLRPSFRHVVLCSTLALAAHTVALALHPGIDPIIAIAAASCLVVATYVSLLNNASIERDLRRIFLLRLSESLAASDLQRAAADLHRMSLVDPLTGLANRRGIDARAEGIAAAAAGPKASVAVLMIDVDRFKPFNDCYGHPAGDQCLVEVARGIRGSVRDGVDLAGRYGGEEFLVLLPGTEPEEALRAAERIRASVESLALPHAASEAGIVTVSIGVAIAEPAQVDGLNRTIADADAALYVAKQAGRNRVRAALPGLHTRRQPAAAKGVPDAA
ncbi:diguanylate cyclase [Phreatobacter sp.]|uniref:GGDEF domain-containing protein n=1 Tax=Phreatobacter sp. TaxID=1966341 RepID=UPI0025D2AC90|nr:GGDEF domain-containing protein [Phreatobacter sp.]